MRRKKAPTRGPAEVDYEEPIEHSLPSAETHIRRRMHRNIKPVHSISQATYPSSSASPGEQRAPHRDHCCRALPPVSAQVATPRRRGVRFDREEYWQARASRRGLW